MGSKEIRNLENCGKKAFGFIGIKRERVKNKNCGYEFAEKVSINAEDDVNITQIFMMGNQGIENGDKVDDGARFLDEIPPMKECPEIKSGDNSGSFISHFKKGQNATFEESQPGKIKEFCSIEDLKKIM